MTSSPIFERWAASAALLVIGSMLLPGPPARAAVKAEALLQPTPLVLKDGRIANVSIHVLPFANGEGQLAGDAAAGLADLTGTIATDCFLTAQVIGHVSSREVADNDTLAAHRLARARADAVQASLIGGGLPAKAIASVWDWQFLVREPRATLWIFRLVQGEDCEGAPLDGGDALVAQNDAAPAAAAPAAPARAAAPPPAQAAAPAATPPAQAEQASGPDLAGVVGSAVAAEAMPPSEPADARQAPAAPEETPRRAATAGASPAPAAAQAARAEPQRTAEAAAEAATAPTVTRPLPALSPAAADDGSAAEPARPAGGTAVAAVDPAPAGAGAAAQPGPTAAAPQQQSAAAEDPERQGKVEWGQDNVVITFATNSSYFPPGTARRLATLLDDLAAGGRYRVRLEVGVSGSDQVVGATTAEEAKRYNRWLAERRLTRVREWLDENAGDRQLEIEPSFQADDSSRRVVVRVAPIG